MVPCYTILVILFFGNWQVSCFLRSALYNLFRTITAVGKQSSRKNEQKVVFQEKDFQEIGNILREIMNVLGFYNEYNRPDRDQIVNVYMDNLRVGK